MNRTREPAARAGGASAAGRSVGALYGPVLTGAVLTGVGAGLAAFNRLTMRQLDAVPTTVIEPVTVCVPARDEARRLPALIADLRAQQGVPRLRVLILDDRSADATYEAAAAAAGGAERVTVICAGTEPAPREVAQKRGPAPRQPPPEQGLEPAQRVPV
ncbi:glycosyltransferase [Nocardia wallacei]|uniref:glycosyltransferase n=1 Tax=Nocardia wallacei TaxID=480035 RepID=UPI00313B1B1E